MFYLFPCCPGLYFIGCLGRYLLYFIAAQGDIPLVAWADILFISLLPRALFHWLPGPIFYLFHCCLALYFIGCLGDILFISLLPRALFHWLPGPIFYLFHCCLGLYFIGCLGDILFISLLPRALFHWLPGRYFIYFIAA